MKQQHELLHVQAEQEHISCYLVTLIIAGQTQLEPAHQWSPISAQLVIRGEAQRSSLEDEGRLGK